MHLREFFKKYPKLYYLIADVFGPMMWTGISAKKFIYIYCAGKNNIINLGSGPRVLEKNIINVDIKRYQGVQIISDITNLPLSDQSAGGIICDTVIEHVSDPQALLKEIKRLLRPGAYAYITVPFLYPFHSSPNDFTRWTKNGAEKMLADFKIVRSGVRAGAFSALNVYCCYLFALIFSFNSNALFWTLMNLSIFIFFPIKLFDLLFSRFHTSSHLAAIMYYIVQKK